MAEKKKYNFKYGAGVTRGRTDVAIYKGAPAYVSQKALKKFPFLMECKWVWGVDKEHGVLALKQDERGHGITILFLIYLFVIFFFLQFFHKRDCCITIDT